MARATAAGGGGGRGRPTASAPRAERASYAVEVYQELRKTTWPTGRELRRMTEVVVATVVMFGLIIGGLDLLLSIIVKPIYTQIGTTQASSTPQQVFTPVPRTAAPVTSAAPGAATGTGTVTSSSSLVSPAASAAPSKTP